MDKFAICTISTKSHIFKSKALFDSVRRFNDVDCLCLLTDTYDMPLDGEGIFYNDLSVLSDEISIRIKKKYKGDRLRWACKPMYIKRLVQMGYSRVIYVDNDICFFSSADFLFESLKNSRLLLTPHYYSISVWQEQNWLEANFRVGLYNAGFIGANLNAIPILDWWANCCLYNVKKSAWRGLFDDQKYLDLVPVSFEGVEIVRHKGCNVAGWNLEVCTRSSAGNKEIFLDGVWPLVFVHFAKITYRQILNGSDKLLTAHLHEYSTMLKKHKHDYLPENELKRGLNDYLLYFRHIIWRIARLFE